MKLRILIRVRIEEGEPFLYVQYQKRKGNMRTYYYYSCEECLRKAYSPFRL